MILFESDFKKYNAIVHNETKNVSFLKVATILKKMGIANHNFLLALHNPLLRNIDPHSPDLTTEEIGMIVEECFN